jgi:hypothetical protein
MAKPRPSVLIAALLLIVLAAFAASSFLFAAQGGFGRGHGQFDRGLYFLGAPWLLILAAMQWSESIWLGDYVMIVLLPLVCNLTVVAVLWLLLKRRR